MSHCAADAEFSHLWRVSTLRGSKSENTKMSTAEMSPQRKGEFADRMCRLAWIKPGFEI